MERLPAPQSRLVAVPGRPGSSRADCGVGCLRTLFAPSPARCKTETGACCVTFDRAWVLFLLVLPLAFAAWEWRRQPRRVPLLLKAAMIVAVILALSVPSLSFRARKVALAVLV